MLTDITDTFFLNNPYVGDTEVYIADIFSTSLSQLYNNSKWTDWNLTIYLNDKSTTRYKMVLFHPVLRLYGVYKFNKVNKPSGQLAAGFIQINNLHTLTKGRLKGIGRLPAKLVEMCKEERELLEKLAEDTTAEIGYLKHVLGVRIPEIARHSLEGFTIEELYHQINKLQEKELQELHTLRMERARSSSGGILPTQSEDYDNVIKLIFG